jgi:methionyl-tRNA synthetase
MSLPQEAPSSEITLQDFQRIQLRTGTIVAAELHLQADRLLILKVDIGGGAPHRQVVAGIRSAYQPSDLLGKQVVIVTNLKPAMLRGVESQGMVLAASDPAAGIVLVCPDRPVPPGSTVK